MGTSLGSRRSHSMDSTQLPPSLRIMCGTCGLPIAGPLAHLTDLTLVNSADEAPLIPSGTYVVAGELKGVYEATWVPKDAVLMNRADVQDLQEVGNREGCCGPDGMGGPNLACRLGHPVAVEMADCWTPKLV